jgi:1-aminocyclopropane-1-carboxylate deaminase/D-cysteine desulfhydrase-like pyridoxal-dependent ACC family enzyme
VKAQKGRWLEIPFGMEGSFAIKCTAHQVDNLPSSINRIILPVGSGMTLIGLLIGLQARPSIPPIVGVVVGKDPSSTLDRWLSNWRQHVTLVNSEINYHQSAPITNFYGIDLDPIYEAKVIPYLQPGDLLWLVGYHDPK